MCLYIDSLSLLVTWKLPEDRQLWLVCPCRSVSSVLVLLHTERAHLIAAVHSGINPAITYRINAVPIKTAVSYFTDLDKTIQEFIPSHKGSEMAKAILKGKNTVGGITMPNIKLYYRATVIKSAWYWHESRPRE